ncbi:MAG TPA: glycosyltransferase [Albitalea sp.]|uniref:glycosyltransferase n=1 Tax=Piscinibacter sp. TaxID=1903157 RepID=UPI002ED142A1
MRHLVVFCHLRWDFVYQRPQHLLSRLARHFKVHVIEEPMLCEGDAWLERVDAAEGVTVLKPHTPIDTRGFDDAQQPLLLQLIADYMKVQAIDECIAWLYTPMAMPLLQALPARSVVFDCMDELSAFKGAPAQLRRREAELMQRADLVLTGGPSLYEARRDLHPNVVCLPSAVDAAHYAPTGAAPRADADGGLQAHLARPRLGFFGVIDERLDIGLVDALAAADPRWQVVMVGPVVKIDPASLPQRPNIHWLGQQPYARLPALVAGWDVCLLPFALNESTRFISPTKTLEYMAADKPVVGTPVRDVVAMYDGVVRIGHDPGEFIAACRAALQEDALARAERETRMRAIVARSSWDAAAARVHAALDALHPTRQPDASPARIREVAWN